MMATWIFSQYELSTGIRLVISGLSQSRKLTKSRVPEKSNANGIVNFDLEENIRPDNSTPQATKTNISKPSLQGGCLAINHRSKRCRVKAIHPIQDIIAPVFHIIRSIFRSSKSVKIPVINIKIPNSQNTPKSLFPRLTLV